MSEPAVNYGPLVKSISIENLLAQHDGVLERIRAALASFAAAREICDASGISGALYSSFERILCGDKYYNMEILGDKALESISKRLDACAWHHLMHESGIRTLMDTKARAEWDEKIHKADVPPLTAENIKATFGLMYQNRGEIFERGVLNVFKELAWNYKTNRPFLFGKRIVIEYLRSSVSGEAGTSLGWPRHEKCNKVDDLIRCFHVLDGKPEPDHRNGIYHLLYDQERKNLRVVDSEYLSFRSFRNGNAHVTFKRLDLVEKMNRIVAKHHPAALPDDRHERAREFSPAKVA